MKVQQSSVEILKNKLQMLKIDENLIGISDEGAYFLYRIIDTVFDWILREYEPKIARMMLHQYDIAMQNNYDPTQYYDDRNDDDSSSVEFNDDLPF